MALEEAWVEDMELYRWVVWVCPVLLASAVPPQTALHMVMTANYFYFFAWKWHLVPMASKLIVCSVIFVKTLMTHPGLWLRIYASIISFNRRTHSVLVSSPQTLDTHLTHRAENIEGFGSWGYMLVSQWRLYHSQSVFLYLEALNRTQKDVIGLCFL